MKASLAGVAALGFAFALVACSGGDPAVPVDPPAPPGGVLTLTPVVFNPAKVDLGTVAAVADDGMQVAVFGSKGLTTFASGALVAADTSIVSWRSAGVIPAADGTATWLVGIDGQGHLRKVGDSTAPAPEDVSDRFGLLDAKVAAVSGSDGTHGPPTAFLLDDGFALSNGKVVTRYSAPAIAIATGSGKAAIASDGLIRILDNGTEHDVPLPNVTAVAYDTSGGLYATTAHALFVIAGTTPQQVYDAGSGNVHGLVGSGAGVWIAIDHDVALFRDQHFSVTASGTFALDARLFGSPSGDVWILSGADLARFSGQASTGDDHATWTATVEPIFGSVCGACHSAKGSGKDTANFDLSTYEAWSASRSVIRTRVVTDANTPQAMPPPSSGMTLTSDQRSAIDAWSQQKP